MLQIRRRSRMMRVGRRRRRRPSIVLVRSLGWVLQLENPISHAQSSIIKQSCLFLPNTVDLMALYAAGHNKRWHRWKDRRRLLWRPQIKCFSGYTFLTCLFWVLSNSSEVGGGTTRRLNARYIFEHDATTTILFPHFVSFSYILSSPLHSLYMRGNTK